MDTNGHTPVKRFERAARDRWIGGVAAGLARYFAIDPLLVRLIFLVAFLGFGTGFLVYLVLWLLMPVSNEF